MFLVWPGCSATRDRLIATLHLKHGYTQAQIASHQGLHYASVSRIVNRKTDARNKTRPDLTPWFSAEIASLKRRIPDLGDVSDPDSFIKLMRQRGHQVSSNEISVARGKAVEVKVPEKELFLIFVAPEVCENTIAK